MKIDDRMLTQALINSNKRFLESLPTDMEEHVFSKTFERKMKHLVTASKKYGSNLWLERFITYAAKAAVIVVCLITVNFVSVKAFDFNIWNVIITKTGEFLNINFEKPADDIIGMKAMRLKIVNLPEEYKQQEMYQSDDLSVQQFVSEGGTITYTESLISETADVNIESGIASTEKIGNWQVSYIAGEDSITAFFTDEKYYHIVEIQGVDANEEFAGKIIEELEEQ